MINQSSFFDETHLILIFGMGFSFPLYRDLITETGMGVIFGTVPAPATDPTPAPAAGPYLAPAPNPAPTPAVCYI